MDQKILQFWKRFFDEYMLFEKGEGDIIFYEIIQLKKKINENVLLLKAKLKKIFRYLIREKIVFLLKNRELIIF